MGEVKCGPRSVDFGTVMNTPEVAISAVFRRSLTDQRDTLNALFRSRVKQGAKIDHQAFAEHVRTRIGKIIAAIELALPERTRLATAELFEISLELFAAGHFGDGAKTRYLSALWEELMPTIARHVARDPRRVAGCLSNALVQIELQSTRSANRWLNLITQLNHSVESVDELLVLGKVTAWISGMSHFRRSALTAARLLPTRTVSRLFDLDPDTDESAIRNFLFQLDKNPWCNSIDTRMGDGEVKQVAICGAFRGFGGSLMKPPSVATIDGKLIVSDRQQVWQIFADRFGSVIQRVDLKPFRGNGAYAKSNPRVTSGGTIQWDGHTTNHPDLANPTSFAFDGTTLAVTIPSSFHVFLFARTSLSIPSA